jgi:hypothetical protein
MTAGAAGVIVEPTPVRWKGSPMHISVETSLLSVRAVEVLLVLLAALVCGVQRDKRPPR